MGLINLEPTFGEGEELPGAAQQPGRWRTGPSPACSPDLDRRCLHAKPAEPSPRHRFGQIPDDQTENIDTVATAAHAR